MSVESIVESIEESSFIVCAPPQPVQAMGKSRRHKFSEHPLALMSWPFTPNVMDL